MIVQQKAVIVPRHAVAEPGQLVAGLRLPVLCYPRHPGPQGRVEVVSEEISKDL
jgi:hypothetical protein